MKRISKEELLFIVNNLSKSNEELSGMLGRTPKSVKHMRNKLSKINDGIVQYVKTHSNSKSPGEIEKDLGLEPGFIRIVCTLHDIKLDKNRTSTWTKSEIERLKSLYPEKGLKETAKILNISDVRVRIMASKLALKRDYSYSKNEERKIIEDFLSGISAMEIAEETKRTPQAIYNFLYRKEIVNPQNTASRYYISGPEKYIIRYLNEKIDVNIPDKTVYENRNHFWGVVGKYELDVPFYIDNKKYVIEYNGQHWHEGKEESDKKKQKALEGAGYEVFIINSQDHNNNYYDLTTLNPILDRIINQILS